MSVFSHPEFDHEKVLYCHDPAVKLNAIIALHSTALGPAAGGCRMHPYKSDDDALTDVLRLSKGMSYKNAIAGIPLGGGWKYNYKCKIKKEEQLTMPANVVAMMSITDPEIYKQYTQRTQPIVQNT